MDSLLRIIDLLEGVGFGSIGRQNIVINILIRIVTIGCPKSASI